MKPMAKSEYEHLRTMSCRSRSGERIVTYWDDQGGVFVKTFGDHIKVEKVTEEQWENAVMNHGIRLVGEDSQ